MKTILESKPLAIILALALSALLVSGCVDTTARSGSSNRAGETTPRDAASVTFVRDAVASCKAECELHFDIDSAAYIECIYRCNRDHENKSGSIGDPGSPAGVGRERPSRTSRESDIFQGIDESSGRSKRVRMDRQGSTITNTNTNHESSAAESTVSDSQVKWIKETIAKNVVNELYPSMRYEPISWGTFSREKSTFIAEHTFEIDGIRKQKRFTLNTSGRVIDLTDVK